ncbi:hypothetical protein OG407_43100 [Streptomyces sp. NBC_01515]|uniref:hypothetical protein n=1 Tax=Streptomyces sp. NBC_01515 TaxID=2903890 RepID=UPI0038678FD6
MPPHAGALLSHGRFLALSATGAGVGAAVLNGCALQVSTGVSGAGETVMPLLLAADGTTGDVTANPQSNHR